jgi:DNA-binding transcriptional LysR family regulator
MLNEIDLSRTDLNLLVLFEVLWQGCHVGRAAERLSLSPSAVSHGLGRLRRLLNDPVFVRTPKGVVPTDRARELSGAITDALTRVRSVVALAEPFDAMSSTRQFTIGAPDGVSAVLLRPLLEITSKQAPGINLGIRRLLPSQTDVSPERIWRNAIAELDARAMDVAIVPSNEVPARFETRLLYQEDFVLILRENHPFADSLDLDRYCEMQHLVVSFGGNLHGVVDDVLKTVGRSRRIALTVPNFMFALSMVAETDMVSAVPRAFAAMYGGRHGIVSREPPLSLGTFSLNIVVPRAAMMDAGIDWLFRTILASCQSDRRELRSAPDMDSVSHLGS